MQVISCMSLYASEYLPVKCGAARVRSQESVGESRQAIDGWGSRVGGLDQPKAVVAA